MTTTVAECYFLDVGQGTSQIIDLGDDTAIVIDCGPRPHVPIDLLDRKLGIGRIAALILSHNHQDHIGGLPGIIERYAGRIDSIFMLQDQPAASQLAKEALSCLYEASKKKLVPDPIPLSRNARTVWIYGDEKKADSVRLEVLYPTFIQNLEGQLTGNPNNCCGVVMLHCDSRRILFAGDAELSTLKALYESRGDNPIECDVTSVPHHGGQIVRYRKPDESYEELHADIEPSLIWVYQNVIKAKYAIVSVGTNNPYNDKHPIPPQIRALLASGACVLCTQITSRCTKNLAKVRGGVMDADATPRAGGAGSPDHVSCAGTVLVEISPLRIAPLRADDHAAAVAAKLSDPSDHPLCRH